MSRQVFFIASASLETFYKTIVSKKKKQKTVVSTVWNWMFPNPGSEGVEFPGPLGNSKFVA